MAGKRDRDGVAARIRALLAETADLATDELERRAKSLTSIARAEQILAGLAEAEAGAQAERGRGYIDDAAEGALRDQLMRRMVMLEAQILARRNSGGAGG